MAIAFDNSADGGLSTADPFEFVYGPSGTPKGVIVVIAKATGLVDSVNGVTYGGVAMTRVAMAFKTSGEGGRIWVYFLGASIPTGDQTVSIDTDGLGAELAAFVITVTAGTAQTAVNGFNEFINSDSQENPSGTQTLNSISSFVAEILFSGQNAIGGITPSTGWTNVGENDLGTATCGCYRYDTIGTSDVTVGWTQTAEDAIGISFAIKELTAGARSQGYIF